MTLTVELSWPEPCLWPNARPDRRAKSAVARQGRDEGYVATLQELSGRSFKSTALEIPVRIIGQRPSARHYDRDNFLAACKSRLDGMAQALIFNHRYESALLKKTVTLYGSNFAADSEKVDDWFYDRLRDGRFHIVHVAGPSLRPAMRES